jgi:hypothetical protein
MDDLQFERAEFGTAATAKTCTGCHQPIAGDFYDVNGQPFCPACKAAIEQAHGSDPGPAVLGRALGAGLVAGAIGSALFYIVEHLSGYRLSIIAIAVGYLVGRGVRWGTGGRGGLVYQLIAVALTYTSIAFSSLPYVLAGDSAPLGLVDLPALTTFLLALPIRQGIESPLGLVIIGIGLYEAWTFNAPVKLAITGPFAAAPPASPAQSFPPLPPVPPMPPISTGAP